MSAHFEAGNAAIQLPPAIRQKASYDTWTRILVQVWENPEQVLRLVFDGAHPLGYQYGESSIEHFPRILASMTQASLLSPVLAHRAYACPKCESIKVLMQESCVTCRSDLVFEQPIIHHFDCAYQATEPHFYRTEEGYLQCPKCQRHLKHQGLDHDKPGVGYYCQACQKTHADIKVQGTCLNCSERFEPASQHQINLYHYRLSETGIQNILNQTDTQNNTFQRHFSSYTNLAKTNRLQTCLISFIGSAQNEDYLQNIGELLQTHLSEEQALDREAGCIKLLLPGFNVQEAQAFIDQNFAHLQPMLKITVKDILELS